VYGVVAAMAGVLIDFDLVVDVHVHVVEGEGGYIF
jgi:hypothetical protein